MQYCMILEVESVAEATSVGMMLERLGYEVVSARIERSNFPAPKVVEQGQDSGLAVGSAQPQKWQGELAILSS
jgi:hypothetical protein